MSFNNAIGWILVLCMFTLVGCSGEGSDPSETGSSTVAGQAYLENNVDADNLEFYDSEGIELDHQDDGTNEHGTFVATVYNLPTDFEVVVSIPDPTLESRSSETVKLRAFCSNFYSADDFIVVNAVTTLVCVYMEKHPAMSYEQAEAAVKKFLEIPEDYDITNIWGNPDQPFYHHAFMNEARQMGGVNNLILSLMDEIDQGGTHSFAKGLLGDGIDWTKYGKWLGGNLASGAVSGAGNALFGMALGAMGIDFGVDGKLAEISRKLDMIAAQIVALGKKLEKDMENYHNKDQYDTLLATITDAIADIKAWNSTMRDYAETIGKGEAVAPKHVDDLAKLILAEAGYLDRLGTFQVGESAIQLHSALQTLESIVIDRFFCNEVQYKTLRTQFDAFYGYQFQELNLLTSAYTRDTPPSLNLAALRYKQYWKYIKEEYSMLPLPLGNDCIILDRTNKRLWTRAPVFTGRTGEKDYKDALRLAIVFNVQPYFGWRLPTPEELQSICPWPDQKSYGFNITEPDLHYYFYTNKYGYRSGPSPSFEPIFYAYYVNMWTGEEVKIEDDHQAKLLLVYDIGKGKDDSRIQIAFPEEGRTDMDLHCSDPVYHADRTWSRVLACWRDSDYDASIFINPCLFWQSSVESVATVSNEPGDDGLKIFSYRADDCPEGVVTWHKAGTPVKITGSRWVNGLYFSWSGTLPGVASVPTPVLKTIGVYPENKYYKSLPTRVEYFSKGVYSDGTYKDLIKLVKWSTTGPAHFDSQKGYEGNLTVDTYPSESDLPLKVTATYQGITGTTEYTVPTSAQ